ncbi:catabolite control protein A [Limosilactobacillus caecicola]|uniref:catabolite control protein A n=1 Tax=Limosilactobacillus caecicola TaxID=2941332 RepID=UPI00203C02A3|nr:catabolite control protein A [Limosilactobacillus caecicola]
MEKQTITIYTVASEAHVSMATVSRVVNGNPNVKPDTRKKVLEVIKKLNYRPNAVARGLASKKTTTVGVVIPDITNNYFAKLAQGIDDIATMYKYNMILTNSDADDKKAIQVVRSMYAKQVDGIIFMGHDVSQELQDEFKNSTVPVVVAGSVTNDASLPAVRIDYENATKEATAHLLKGNQKVALIIGSKDTTINAKYRIPGYQSALKEAGIPFDEQTIFEAHDSYDEGYSLAEQIMQSGATAAFSSDDGIAAGVLNGLFDHSVKVPDDFEIITGNDTQLATVTRPMMSSITLPLYDIGAVSMRLLTKLMSGDDADAEADAEKDENNVILQHGFVKRQSTKS